MNKQGIGRDHVKQAIWEREYYPHPLISCLMPLFAIFGVSLVLLLGFTLWQVTRPGSVNIPNVLGEPVDRAISQLKQVGLEVDVMKERKADEKIPAGAVVRMMPTAGRRVREGRTIHLQISAGSAYAIVPDVIDLPQADAYEKLKEIGLRASVEKEVYDEHVQFDHIISISPGPGIKLTKDSTVSLVISKGPKIADEVFDPSTKELRSSVLTIDVPSTAKTGVEVRVDITDNDGKKTVFQEKHDPGDNIVFTAQGTGESTAEVYIGDELYLTRKF